MEAVEMMSMDTRERVAAAKSAGHPASEVAEVFGVSASEVYRLAKRKRETGTVDGTTLAEVSEACGLGMTPSGA